MTASSAHPGSRQSILAGQAAKVEVVAWAKGLEPSRLSDCTSRHNGRFVFHQLQTKPFMHYRTDSLFLDTADVARQACV